jgi:hypothetical protein
VELTFSFCCILILQTQNYDLFFDEWNDGYWVFGEVILGLGFGEGDMT